MQTFWKRSLVPEPMCSILRLSTFRVLHISTIYTLLSMLLLKGPVKLHLIVYLLNNQTWHHLISQIALSIGENRTPLPCFYWILFFKWQLKFYYATYVSIEPSWCRSVSTNYRHSHLLLCAFLKIYRLVCRIKYLEEENVQEIGLTSLLLTPLGSGFTSILRNKHSFPDFSHDMFKPFCRSGLGLLNVV